MVSVPVTSGTSGFVYEFNPTLGVPQRAGDGFGPIFTERPLRSGEGQLALGLVFQRATFSSIGGRALGAGDFPVTSTRTTANAQLVADDRLRLGLSSRTMSLRMLYGVNDRLDVGATVPYVQVDVDGTRLSTQQGGQPPFQVVGQGRAAGFGDASMSARVRVLGARASGVALGADLRLPTGSARQLLGTGRLAARGQVIAGIERDRVGAAANVGLGIGGASDELFASAALTLAPAQRLTLVGEVLARRLTGLHPVTQVYAAHSSLPGVESMRWTADETTGTTLGYLVFGAKWNVSGPILLSAHVLVRTTASGLRARLTPTLSVDYAFQP